MAKSQEKAKRTVEVPADLKKALSRNPGAREAWDRLSYTHQKEHAQAIADAKKPETRVRRVEKTIEALEALQARQGRPEKPAPSTRPLALKLQLKPGGAMAVLNAPDGFLDALGGLPSGASVQPKVNAATTCALLFVRNSNELGTHLGKVLDRLAPEAVLWMAYPKKSSGVETDLTRDVGWEAATRAGLEVVSAVAVDNVWSALRFSRT